MKKSLFLLSVLACASFAFVACDEKEDPTPCNTNADCDYPAYWCSNNKCIRNSNYTPDQQEPTPGPNDPTPGPNEPTPGESFPQVTFSLSYGSSLTHMTIQKWQTVLPEQANASGSGEGEIVIMLCKEDDPTCKSPEKVVTVTEAEGWKSKPIQGSNGPTISMSSLPAGTWNMMIFEDSSISAANGRSYKDPNPICYEGEDWGCIVSETDRMLVSKEDYDAYAKNTDKNKLGIYPQPSTIKVTIPEKCADAGCTQDLGQLLLAHYHERNISINARPENGYIAVGTAGGLRVVDLNDFSVQKSYGEMFDYTLVDSDDSAINGVPCGMMDGGDGSTVWVIYNMKGNGKDNIAVPFDVQKKQQIGNKHVVLKDLASNSSLCRGIVKDGKMYAWSRFQGKPAAGNILYVPSIQDVLDNKANVEHDSCVERSETTKACMKDPIAYLRGTESLAVWHDTVFTLQGNLDADGKHKGSNGGICSDGESQCIFMTKAGEEFLEAISEKGKDDTFIDGGNYWEQSTTAAGDKTECKVNDYFFNVPALTIVEKSNTEAWLIASKCLSVAAWKLKYDAGSGKISYERMKLSDMPGQNNLDSSQFGVYITDWELSPDKKYLYGMPSGPSATMLYTKQGTEDKYTSSNRTLGMVLDVSGDKPKYAADEQFNRNIDGYEGNNGDGNPKSPAIDMGLDIQQHWYTQYFTEWTNNLQGAVTTFRPARIKMVVSNNTLWLTRIGDGTEEGGKATKNTLGHYRDIATYDLKEGRSILWPHQNETYYHPYTGGTDNLRPSGFPLDPNGFDTVNTMGIVYLPKK